MAPSPTKKAGGRKRWNRSRGRSSSPPNSAKTRRRMGRPGVGLDSRPEQIKRVAEASLRRLRVEAIDLLPTPARPGRARRDVAGAVRDLIQVGKGRHFRAFRIERRPDSPRPQSNRSQPWQSGYSIWWTPWKRKFCPLWKNLVSVWYLWSSGARLSDRQGWRARRTTVPTFAAAIRASRQRRSGPTGRWLVAGTHRCAAQRHAGPDRPGLAAGPKSRGLCLFRYS